MTADVAAAAADGIALRTCQTAMTTSEPKTVQPLRTLTVTRNTSWSCVERHRCTDRSTPRRKSSTTELTGDADCDDSLEHHLLNRIERHHLMSSRTVDRKWFQVTSLVAASSPSTCQRLPLRRHMNTFGRRRTEMERLDLFRVQRRCRTASGRRMHQWMNWMLYLT